MVAAQPLCTIPVMTDTILAEENARLKARLAETKAALADVVEAQKQLESLVSELRREKCGRKSEKLDPEQLNLPLEAAGIENFVIDPTSLLVNRRARWAKTDRIDVRGLLRSLIAWQRGDKDVCCMVHPPSPAQENARRPHRERQRLIKERGAHVNRIKGLLATQGIYNYQPLRRDRHSVLAELTTADGQPLPPGLYRKLERELVRLDLEHFLVRFTRLQPTPLQGSQCAGTQDHGRNLLAPATVAT